MLLDGLHAGELTSDRNGVLEFSYLPEYLDDDDATPMSVSIPLAAGTAGREQLLAFLWGLLPDNQLVLDRWSQQYQVSASSAFALLANVGEECAGAVQFARPERLDAIANGGVNWLEEDEVGAWLRTLQRDPAAWHLAGHGQFSLAGAQAKIALRHESGRWGDPWGSEPTNVILKPAANNLDDQELNEHICLELARSIGLLAARSSVRAFSSQRAICVERYDRLATESEGWIRVHQEDLCQALGVRPSRKYQSDGGPSALDVIALLRDVVTPFDRAEQSVQSFLDALVLNWLLAATDGHAKNYSLLLSGPDIVIAPLYDVTSVLPYLSRDPRPDRNTQWNPSQVRLAMNVTGEYHVQAIGLQHWRGLAENARIDEDLLVSRIKEVAEALPEAMAEIISREEIRALGSDLPKTFARELELQLGLCRVAMIGRPAAARRNRRVARP